MTSMLIGALSLAQTYGFSLIAVHPRGKRPIEYDWPNKATADPAVITDTWTRWPEANVGVATGSRFGIVVLDVDVKGGGLESYERLKASQLAWSTKSLTACTGSGGFHIYFREDSLKLPTNAGKLAPGLDIRGEGGFVVAPPSLHANGNRYEWIH